MFSKKPLTIEQQIEHLISQGLIIENIDEATRVLSMISYYRLSGYMLPFKTNHDSQAPRKFKQGSTFHQIWQIYQFDQELRLLVMDAIEKIEVAIRSSIINVMSTETSPFFYTEEKYFKNDFFYQGLMENVLKIKNSQHDIFIKHYYTNYDHPPYPPIWMISETMSFGTISKLFQNIKQVAYKKEICKLFKQSPIIMDSWLKTITYVRNICAHHSRLWNQWLVYAPKALRTDHFLNTRKQDNRRFIFTAYIIMQLLKEIAPKSPWQQKLFSLLEKYKHFLNFPSMGFQENWDNDSFWK